MQEQFAIFHSFADEALINDFAEKLHEKDIEFKIEKNRTLLDTAIIGHSSIPDFVILLRPEDFEKGHDCLGEYYRSQINAVDKDYYLFEFSDEELFDLVSKPDEWGYFDYQLAIKILKDRGKKVDEDVLKKLKETRKEELAKLEKPGLFLYVVAYFFIFSGFLSFISPVFDYSDFSFLGTLFSFFIGRHIQHNKKTLPDGQSVYTYSEKNRAHGKIVKNIALIIFISAVLKRLILSLIIASD